MGFDGVCIVVVVDFGACLVRRQFMTYAYRFQNLSVRDVPSGSQGGIRSCSVTSTFFSS